MSEKTNNRTGMKIRTISDLETEASRIENNLENAERSVLVKIMEGFLELTKFLDRNEPGICSCVIKWISLYLRMQTTIAARSKLRQQFEQSIPATTTYIIGCLQYKSSNDVTDYHYRVLDLLDAVIQNTPQKVISQFRIFDKGIISHIWKTITFVGDFNTQLLALNVFARILNCFDIGRREDELKTIKWTNLKLFKDNLVKVIETSNQRLTFENACRDLLNSYNMNLSGKLLVYSFYCKAVTLENQSELFKPLLCEKFWIDINCYPQTISFKCRYNEKSQSPKVEDLNVTVNWKCLKLENDFLLIYIDKIKTRGLSNDVYSSFNCKAIKITLPQTEIKRIMENEILMDYLKKFADNNMDNATVKISNAIIPKPLSKGSPEFPLGNEVNDQLNQQCSSRQTRKRKFFTYLKNDEDAKSKKQSMKDIKKTSSVKNLRILKPRNCRKSVCAVIPVCVDLTKSSGTKRMFSDIESKSNNKINILQESKQLNENQYKMILNEVDYLCHDGKIYDQLQGESYAEPCQSYRNYKTQFSVYASTPHKSEENSEESKNDKTPRRPIKCNNRKPKSDSQNEETPQRPIQYKRRKRKISSQNKNGVLKLQKQFFIKNNPNQSASIEQDLIEDDFCKMSTSIDEKKTTPTSIYSVTSLPKTPISNDIMDVSDSDINNTASIGITRSYTMNRFLEKEFRTDDDNRFGKQEWNINEAQENICKQYGESNHNSKHLNYDKTNVNGCCVVYQHRLSDDDDCSDRDDEPQIYLSSNQSSFYINAPKMSEENKAFTHNQLVNNDIRKTNPSSLIEGNNIKSYKRCTSFVYQIKAPPIMLMGHHTKFSSKENILIIHHKSDFLNKDIICKKFENTLNSKQSNEENSSSTIFKFNKYLGTTKVAFEKSGKPSYKMNVPPLVVSSSTNSFTSVENILIGNCNNIFAINSNTVSDISKIKIDPRHLSFIHRNEYSSDVDVSSTDTHDLSTKFMLKSGKEEGNFEIESKFDFTTDSDYHTMNNSGDSQSSEHSDILNTDLSNLNIAYRRKLTSNVVDNLRRQLLSNSLENIKQEICDITENIINMSKKQRKDIESIQATIQMLMTQMMNVYQIYVQKSEDYYRFQKSALNTLDVLNSLNINMQSDIPNEYNNLRTQFNNLETHIRQEVWQYYLNIKKRDILNKIDALSAI